MLFGFSLRDKAQTWLNDVKETEWSAISQAFLEEFFPPIKTAEIRHKFTTFTQEPEESLREAWDRFKALQRSCPHHNIEKWFLVQIFYHGLQDNTKNTVDSAAGGVFLDKEVDAGYDFLTNLAANHYSTTRTTYRRGKMEVDAYSLLSSQVASLNLKIDSLKLLSLDTTQIEQVNAFNRGNPMTHIPTPIIQQQAPQTNATPEPNMGDLYKLIANMQKTAEIAQKNHDESIKKLKNQNRMLENQVAQLADTLSHRQPGTLLGQSTRPQGQKGKSANAITLRSGTKYDGTPMPTDDATLAKENTNEPEKTIGAEPQIPEVDNDDDVGTNKGKEKISDSLPIVPKLPFPHRMQKTKVDQQLGKFLVMVKNLETFDEAQSKGNRADENRGMQEENRGMQEGSRGMHEELKLLKKKLKQQKQQFKFAIKIGVIMFAFLIWIAMK
ncbi:uncharacterized protein [Spinacia oleracea]|uniref:Retrotransposon gag domain-containing protein n=1 Tax=Spinacia oleracea TaxID=3562 RepID=A0ABM3QR00_SPIOL|nr:uncharacterized protein LOC110797225 [Spinacia oleracea]